MTNSSYAWAFVGAALLGSWFWRFAADQGWPWWVQVAGGVATAVALHATLTRRLNATAQAARGQ